MGSLLMIILIVLLVGGLATWGYGLNASRWQRRCSTSCDNDLGVDRALVYHSETAEMPMDAENMRTNLRYDQADLKSILRYAKAHELERAGRYDIRRPPRLNIWTHTWIHPGCRAESSLMFSLEFDWKKASLLSVRLQPGYDWEVFLDELAKLERAALGDTVYGRSRSQSKV
jgi:hypothetical protein